MDDFDRTLLRVSLIVSLLCIGLVAFWMTTAYAADDSSCQLLGIKGKLSVGWFPPGKTCDYGNGAYVESPSYLRAVVLVLAVTGLPFTYLMRRSLRH